MSNVNILSQSAAAELISQICNTSKTLVADIHIAAVSTLDHIREHSNYTGALALLNGLSNGVRVKGLAAWYKEFSSGKFVPSQDPKTKVWRAELIKDRTDPDFKISEAMAITFADFKEEVGHETLTLEKFLKGLKRTATNTGTHPDGTPKVSERARTMALLLVQAAANIEANKAA